MFKSILLAAVVLMPVGTLHAQTIGVPTQARRATDFTSSLGVNMHLNSEWDTAYSDAANGGTAQVQGNALLGAVRVGSTVTNVSRIANAMLFMGMHNARVSITQAYIRDRMLAVASAVWGFKVNNLFSPSVSIADQFNLLKTVIGNVDTVEGLNEAASNASYAGLYGAPADCRFQSDLYSATQAFNQSQQSNIGVLAPSGVAWTDFANLAPCASQATGSNGHYYSDYWPPTQQVAIDIPYTNLDAPANAPIHASEAGYATNPLTTRGMSEDLAAKWTLSATLGFFKNNVRRTYLYELVDENPQTPMLNDNWNYNEMEMHYGLFNNDWSPKLGAQVLRAQAHIMADNNPGSTTFTPVALPLGVSGLPATGYSLLLQKANGKYVVVIWNEPLHTWTPATNTSWGWEAPVPATKVTISFATPMTAIWGYDPFDRSAVDQYGWSNPKQYFTKTTSVDLQLTDHPLYLLIQP